MESVRFGRLLGDPHAPGRWKLRNQRAERSPDLLEPVRKTGFFSFSGQTDPLAVSLHCEGASLRLSNHVPTVVRVVLEFGVFWCLESCLWSRRTPLSCKRGPNQAGGVEEQSTQVPVVDGDAGSDACVSFSSPKRPFRVLHRKQHSSRPFSLFIWCVWGGTYIFCMFSGGRSTGATWSLECHRILSLYSMSVLWNCMYSCLVCEHCNSGGACDFPFCGQCGEREIAIRLLFRFLDTLSLWITTGLLFGLHCL